MWITSRHERNHFMQQDEAMLVLHSDIVEDPQPLKYSFGAGEFIYKLQYDDISVSTKELIKSFGWGTYDSFMQHDDQELNSFCVKSFEEKLKRFVYDFMWDTMVKVSADIQYIIKCCG